MSVSEYEKKFSELVRLVPYIQADEVLKCKRFLSGLQLMSLKVILFQSIFMIYFILKRLIYVQKYGILHQTAVQ